MSNREKTQIFEIRRILISYCGQYLSPDNVDKISNEIEQSIKNGPCSWAFKQTNLSPTDKK